MFRSACVRLSVMLAMVVASASAVHADQFVFTDWRYDSNPNYEMKADLYGVEYNQYGQATNWVPQNNGPTSYAVDYVAEYNMYRWRLNGSVNNPLILGKRAFTAGKARVYSRSIPNGTWTYQYTLDGVWAP